MSALREAFIEELKDLLDAERQLLKALPKMARAAENEQLQAAFEQHQNETEEQIRRLGRVFAAFEEQPAGKKCKGMQGLIEEAEHIIEEEEGDAALIGAAQKAEHYEIAAYGTLASWAVALGQDDAMQVLNGILEEEKATDKKLTGIAQTVVNSMDSQRESDEEEEKTKPRPAVRRAMSSRGRRTAKRQSAAAPRSKRLRSGGRKQTRPRAAQKS
jgi:ferritin-like metal-binding protein YciE